MTGKDFCQASTTFTITKFVPAGEGKTITDDGLINGNHDPLHDWMRARRKVACNECEIQKSFLVHGYGNEPYNRSGRLAVDYLRGSCPLWNETTKRRGKSDIRRSKIKLDSKIFFPR